MNEQIEHELRRALCRVAPAEGFTERVMARLPESRPSTYGWWYAAVAAMLTVVLLVGGLQRTRNVREQEARRAERQVVFALSLAAEKLQRVNVRLEHSGPEVRVQQKQERRYE
jgi:hypothetical protein